MHTDEYEISLSREIKVCRNVIARVVRTLSMFEGRYGMSSREFAEEAVLDRGPAMMDEADRLSWLEEIGALRTWEKRLSEYEEALRDLKRQRSTPAPL